MTRVIKDVIIAGGGVMGMSTAFNLCKYMEPARICIVEKDPYYAKSATALSWASIRQQFSLRENIQLSQRSVNFLKNVHNYLGEIPGEDDTVSVNYQHGSYLFLAQQATAHLLQQNISVQEAAGVQVRRYTAAELQHKYPYLNVEDIVLASDCVSDEGWFDPWLLLSAYKKKIKHLGVELITGEISRFKSDRAVEVKYADNSVEDFHYGKLVNATGIHAGHTNEMLNSVLPSDQQFTLPVVPQRNDTFLVTCKDGPRNVPLMCCPLNTVMRSEGPNYIVKSSKGVLEHDIKKVDDFGDIDENCFVEDIWPNLAYRIPAMESLKILGGWSAYYEYNTLDQNGLIGQHPLIDNHYNINGFSGHGIQQAPAAGRCLAEQMCQVTPHLDISNLSLQRVIENNPYEERNIL